MAPKRLAPKRLAPKGPKLIHGYRLLIDPEARQSMMRKRRMSSASTSVFYPLKHPQIRTSAFYHCPNILIKCQINEPKNPHWGQPPWHGGGALLRWPERFLQSGG